MAADTRAGHLFSGIILYTHEAGHAILTPFGTFLCQAGDTLMQLAIPIAFVLAAIASRPSHHHPLQAGRDFLSRAIAQAPLANTTSPTTGKRSTHAVQP